VSRSLNKVMLIGNLGADPEVRSTNNGTRVATVSLATSRQWTTQGGEKQEKTEWHRCVVWNTRQSGLADVVEKYLKKGDRVYVEGRIEYRTWQDREGQTRYTTEVNVRDLVMLSGRGDGGTGGAAPGDRAEKGRRAAAPAGEKGAGAGADAAESPAKADSFEDFPEALDEEDDDLPF
jgi:single-strand DNA-binding protein